MPPRYQYPKPVNVGPQELAVVSLLLGDWPEGMQVDPRKGASPREVVASVKGSYTGKNGAVFQAELVTDNLLKFWGTPGEKRK